MKSEKLLGERRLPPNKGKDSMKLPILDNDITNGCNFYGYSVESLMKETSELRNIITKRVNSKRS